MRKKPIIHERKRPRQERSESLVAAILEGAIRVLAREGAARFTTARVAEEAGVSVGSLYQYFPNKEAILFRLQCDEWEQTGALLESILARRDEPALERLRSMVRAFFRSEWEEAALRAALQDAAPLYRDAPEVRGRRKAGVRKMLTFLEEALPDVPPAERAFAAALVTRTMSAVGKTVSLEARAKSDVDAWAVEVSDMLCAYLERLKEQAR